MNNGTSDAAQAIPACRPSANRNAVDTDELSRTKRELMQAEVRLARARATMATAEIDVKMLTTKLRNLVK